MNHLNKSHFDFLGLPMRFALDEAALQSRFRRVQAAVHPDRHANAGATEHRIAMQLATRANEAYGTLRDPGRRAAYLCELHGCPVLAESNTAMAPDFLMQQMAWREALEEARDQADRAALERLEHTLCDHRQALLNELSCCIDEHHDYPAACDAVRRWMFIDQFGREVATAREALSAT
jgi:molecular chaperone HscB